MSTHDAQGAKLEVGDVVLVPCTVLAIIHPEELKTGNMTVETIGERTVAGAGAAGDPRVRFGVNGRQVSKKAEPPQPLAAKPKG